MAISQKPSTFGRYEGATAEFLLPSSGAGVPELVSRRLVQRQADGRLLCGVIVDIEAYSQDAPTCLGYRRHSPQNETLFGELGRFYV